MKAVSLKNLVRKLSNLGLESLGNLYSKDEVPSTEEMGSLCHALLELKGEASSVAIGEEILAAYARFTREEKNEFFQLLAVEFPADEEKVRSAIGKFQDNPDPQAIQLLHEASESPRLELFRSLNMATLGTESLIAMREDILDALPDNPQLSGVDADLLHLFRSWFNRGFLEIKRIDWETPAVVLEKLIEYESVHEIEGWPDLRRRLENDRRCFGFFHPVMPYEPLIFVEVALTNEISSNVTELLKEEVNNNGNGSYNTAIFYSINNCLKGLRGVSFGNLLIKQVVEKLERELPSIKTYSTLSPIPRFSAWLGKELDTLDFIEEDEKVLIRTLLSMPTPGKLEDPDLKKALMKSCAHYLLKVRSRDNPACPVARFHLGNGATLGRINWCADESQNGMQQSAGIMVNYIYDKTSLARNHERYESEGIIVCSAEVKQLLP